MKFYVAGKYEDRNLCKWIMGELTSLGHEITYDWATLLCPVDASKEEQATYILSDIQGIKDAEVFVGVMIFPYHYKGLWIEMGVALALGKPCYLIGNADTDYIFTNHPLVIKFESIQKFLEYVK